MFHILKEWVKCSALQLEYFSLDIQSKWRCDLDILTSYHVCLVGRVHVVNLLVVAAEAVTVIVVDKK